LAPAEKLEHLDRVTANGVHLRVELDRQHAVAEIDEAGSRIPLDDRPGTPGRDPDWIWPERLLRFEWPELPAESPSHRVIDVGAVVRDLRRDALRILERRNECRPQEPADLVLSLDERSNTLAGVLDGTRGIDRRQPRGLFGPVLH